MAARRIPPVYEGRSAQAPGMMRHVPNPTSHRTMEPHPPSGIAENKLAVQAAEIEQLAGDNHSLAATHRALREDLVGAQQEIQRLRAHIRSIQTESDIQIRVLLDKISKMEVDIRAGESVKKDLQQAHIEAQSLVKARQELNAQIQQASQELDKARVDIKKLPEMNAELESLRLEHQKLRATFEYEKGFNIEKVQEMQVMEKDLVGMAREVEKLRAEVFNAEKRAQVPNFYGGQHMNPGHLYPHPMNGGGGGGYVDSYGRPHAAGEGMIPYGSGSVVAATGGVGNATVSNAGGSSTGEGPYDALHAWR